MIIILAYIAIMLTPIALRAQPGPPPGVGNGGPPNPPAGYCAQNPGDPSCNGLATPIGDWKWQLGLCLIGSVYVFYKFKKENQYGIE